MKIKWRIVIFAGLVALVAGCTQLGYYVQAVQGQYSLMSDARPIDNWLADPNVDAKLKGRLAKVQEIRRFAAEELGLPDNDSYKNYADLKRSHVLWNVVATPELSMKPTQWCFPIAGCVNYRGYYNKAEAQAFAVALRRDGYDVQVAGVPAYSTLGWFSDPVLSTFIQYPDAELARLVFHELAHQIVYAKDDSKFNESFAVAVEEVGVERWMAKYGDEKMRMSYAAYEGRKKDFLALLVKYRNQLEVNYASQIGKAEKRQRKVEIFQSLKDEYLVLKEVTWGGYAGYDRWFAEPLSNAHLSSVATYHDLVPGFRALLAQQGSLSGFYRKVRSLSTLEKNTRHAQLVQLVAPAVMPQTAQTSAASVQR
ncbi:MAG: aminopeptidase [Burkholderiales bacterium RIFCSPLOWO2_02_FULL_57_36]|nr:MAG: aminopeptidase [Burkholderiales bacterium RIFCSPLOWO2_02_FULL_57_36]